jgi:hypothetical protein
MWRKCSSCKTEIGFEQEYYLCSVSTCTRNRTGLFFCSLACWDAHLPMMRHRDAWAVKERSPSREAWQQEQEQRTQREQAMNDADDAGDATKNDAKRRVVSGAGAEDDLPRDVLIVVSKLKAYVKARSGMNTSDSVVEVLSDHLRKLCAEAIRNAAKDGRKTVLDRDFSTLV